MVSFVQVFSRCRRKFEFIHCSVAIHIPQNCNIIETPYEEGKFVDVINKCDGSVIIIFSGGLQNKPIVNRKGVTEYREKETTKYLIEFGRKDSLYFKEILHKESGVRICYDNVLIKNVKKYNRYLRLARIQIKEKK